MLFLNRVKNLTYPGKTVSPKILFTFASSLVYTLYFIEIFNKVSPYSTSYYEVYIFARSRLPPLIIIAGTVYA